jgi:chromosome segregation ATPase
MPITIAIPLTVLILSIVALVAFRMYLHAQPRADRWQEMERVLSTLETRCKQIEVMLKAHTDAISDHYAKFDTLKGQHYAPLSGLAELRDEFSRLQMRTETNARAIENVVAEHNRANERVNQVTQTVSALTQTRARM